MNITKYIKIVLITSVLLGSLAGCEKKGGELKTKLHDGVIIASIKDGNKIGERYQIATVAAISYSDDLYFSGRDGDVIATADFINGGFTMELPATVSDEFLRNLNYKYAKASNPDAKFACVTFFKAYNTKGIYVGCFWCGPLFWYADSDVTLTRGGNLSLKKGWNIEYENEKALNDMKWEFYN